MAHFILDRALGIYCISRRSRAEQMSSALDENVTRNASLSARLLSAEAEAQRLTSEIESLQAAATRASVRQLPPSSCV